MADVTGSFQTFTARLGRGAFVLAAIAGAATTAAAQSSAPERFKAYDGPVKKGANALKPDARRLLSSRIERPATMLVVLSEPSVAKARAAALNHRLSSTERDAVVSRVAAQHAALRPELQRRGVAVLGLMHGAVNGIKVELKPAQVAAIKALPGVVAVLPVLTHERTNAVSVPYIGAPLVWQGLPNLSGKRGEGVKVAIIDTGIDYTHANFGGPGTTQAFTAAASTSTAPADPALFGPTAAKVKGGIDLVGDAYDANVAGSVPVPDSNPLDCEGHGSHVAGTAAGLGVTAAGTTYAGPYDSSIYTPGAFIIGPGVAPKADLYAVRVFGCAGSTNVVVDALDWAVNNDMDVVNMSLGSSFGPADSADALASAAAVDAGIVVVASAGNSGPAPYILGSPSSGDGVLSVAATDGRPSFPGALITLSNGQTISAQDSNGAALPPGPFPVTVLRNPDGSVSLGCNSAEYAGTAGKLVVTLRGTCPRIDRATFGQAAGAAAVALINNGAGFGIYEGAIPGVTIPFLGIQPGSDATALTSSATAALAATTLTNPSVGTVASFSSGGPRLGDSILKPGLSAPGVSIFSTAVGTGSQGEFLSGTSMAAPHVAGVAALAVQSHPGWSAAELTSAIATSTDPAKLFDYTARLEGSGLVQPALVAVDQAVVTVDGVPNGSGVSFGFAEFTRDFNAARVIRILNKGESSISFNAVAAATAGVPHSLTLNKSVVDVAPGRTAEIVARLNVPVTTAGASHDESGSALFNEVAGFITLTPTSSSRNNGVALKVPYYLVERGRAQSFATFAAGGGTSAVNVKVSNAVSKVPANADFYALGLQGTRQTAGVFDVRAAGVQSLQLSATSNLLVFAVNTFDRFNNAAAGEVDISIDTNGDGNADYVVISADIGAVTAGSSNGQAGVFVLNVATGALSGPSFLTDAPTDGSIMLLPVYASTLGLTTSSPRFTYGVASFNGNGGSNQTPGKASFNAFTPAISTGAYLQLAAGESGTVPVSINATEYAITPPLGVMVVDQENKAGASQATLLPKPR